MSSRTLARKLADVKPGTIFVGVDLGLDSNTAVAITGRAEHLARFSFANDRDGYDYFYRRLAALQEQNLAPGVLVGMAPTNYFWKLLVTDLEPHQIPYRLINPYTVKKHREGDQLSRSKDDNRDAFTIADLLRTGKFTLTRLLHGDYAELRQAATLYCRLGRDIRRQKNIVHTTAVQLFPELGRFFADLSGHTAKAMLRNHGSAVAISRLAQKAFIAAVRSDLSLAKNCGANYLEACVGSSASRCHSVNAMSTRFASTLRRAPVPAGRFSVLSKCVAGCFSIRHRHERDRFFDFYRF